MILTETCAMRHYHCRRHHRPHIVVCSQILRPIAKMWWNTVTMRLYATRAQLHVALGQMHPVVQMHAAATHMV